MAEDLCATLLPLATRIYEPFASMEIPGRDQSTSVPLSGPTLLIELLLPSIRASDTHTSQ